MRTTRIALAVGAALATFATGCTQMPSRDAPKAATVKPVYRVPSLDGNYDALFVLGRYELANRNAAGAIEAFSKALQVRPHSAQALNALAVAYASAGRHDESVATFREALRLEPRAAHIYSNLGFEFLRVGRLMDAESSLREAARLDPSNLKTRENIALLEAAKGRGPMIASVAVQARARPVGPAVKSAVQEPVVPASVTSRSAPAPSAPTPSVASPSVASPSVASPSVASSPVASSSVATPSVATPSVATPSVATPSVATPSVATPTVATPSVASPAAAASTSADAPHPMPASRASTVSSAAKSATPPAGAVVSAPVSSAAPAAQPSQKVADKPVAPSPAQQAMTKASAPSRPPAAGGSAAASTKWTGASPEKVSIAAAEAPKPAPIVPSEELRLAAPIAESVGTVIPAPVAASIPWPVPAPIVASAEGVLPGSAKGGQRTAQGSARYQSNAPEQATIAVAPPVPVDRVGVESEAATGSARADAQPRSDAAERPSSSKSTDLPGLGATKLVPAAAVSGVADGATQMQTPVWTRTTGPAAGGETIVRVGPGIYELRESRPVAPVRGATEGRAAAAESAHVRTIAAKVRPADLSANEPQPDSASVLVPPPSAQGDDAISPEVARRMQIEGLEISNGVGTLGLASSTARALRGLGFAPTRVSDYLDFDQTRTIILYRPGHLKQAKELRKVLAKNVALIPSRKLLRSEINVRLVIGHDLDGKRILAWSRSPEAVLAGVRAEWRALMGRPIDLSAYADAVRRTDAADGWRWS